MGRVQTALGVVIVLALAALVLGTALGQPLLLSYVETGSMEPTLSPGDGFVAVPTALSGEPEVGDVVVFRAEELQGGGLVTHRIVDRTDEGYVTRGDANPFTDQDGGEPPVSRDRVLATALQVNGNVVVLPGVGTVLGAVPAALDWGQRRLAAAIGTRAVLGTSGIGYMLVGIGALLLVLARTGSGRVASRTRSRKRGRETYSPLLLTALLCGLLVVPATGAMVLGGDTHTVPVSAADTTVPGTVEVGADGTAAVRYRVPNDSPLPTLVVFDPATAGVTVQPAYGVIWPGQETRVTADVVGPTESARVERHFTEARYLPVLPPALLVALHGVHPLLAVLAVDLALAALVVVVVVTLVGIEPLRVRSRNRSAR
jgi:signal peptidase